MTSSLKTELQAVLRSAFNDSLRINHLEPLSGGSINDSYRIETSYGNFFVKTNNALAYPGMFEAEKAGLQLLKNKAEGLKVPSIIASGVIANDSYLILEYISVISNTPSSFEALGRSLAFLHKNSNKDFGLDHDNYIGSLKQYNRLHSSWPEFFIVERLSRQLKLAFDTKKINSDFLSLFEKLYRKIPELFPKEQPALIHGDLWSGNFMTTSGNIPVIYDPAVYYGHREMDIAMTQLFGGFPDIFYKSYNEEFELENGWRERMDVCNLYPLMVHVNLFGCGYENQTKSIVKRFV